MSEEVLEEIEALTAILDEDTVEILSEDDRPAEISIKITPLTASEQEKQYVSLTLVVTLSDGEFSSDSVMEHLVFRKNKLNRENEDLTISRTLVRLSKCSAWS